MAVFERAPVATQQVVTVVFEAAVAFALASTPEHFTHIVAIGDLYGD